MEETYLQSFTKWIKLESYKNKEVQVNLQKMTTELCGLSKYMVFHDTDITHDFVQDMMKCVSFLVRLPTHIIQALL